MKRVVFGLMALVFYPIITVIDLIMVGILYLNKGVRFCWIGIMRCVSDKETTQLSKTMLNAMVNAGYKVYIDGAYPTEIEL